MVDSPSTNISSSSSSSTSVEVAVSANRLERYKELADQASQYAIHMREGDLGKAYVHAKGAANWIESIARISKTKPSYLERIDVEKGKVTKTRRTSSGIGRKKLKR